MTSGLQAHVRADVEIVVFSDGTSAWHKAKTDSIIVRLASIPQETDVFTRKERMRAIQLFQLYREQDASGVSGTGIVAEGGSFSDGLTALRWLTGGGSTAIYDSPEHVIRIHGHGGMTRMVYPGDPEFVR